MKIKHLLYFSKNRNIYSGRVREKSRNWENTWMIGKIPEHIKRRGRKEREKETSAYTVKKKWRIINHHYAFMTVRSVYERNLPF